MDSTIRIKDIPQTETYLFAKKVDYQDSTLIGIPSYKVVKFVITNVAIYFKIANVLIDLSGTLRERIDEISTLKIKNHLLNKNFKSLTITTPFGKHTINLKAQDYQEVTKILFQINPAIVIEDLSGSKSIIK